jgi:hypothetical protein
VFELKEGSARPQREVSLSSKKGAFDLKEPGLEAAMHGGKGEKTRKIKPQPKGL